MRFTVLFCSVLSHFAKSFIIVKLECHARWRILHFTNRIHILNTKGTWEFSCVLFLFIHIIPTLQKQLLRAIVIKLRNYLKVCYTKNTQRRIYRKNTHFSERRERMMQKYRHIKEKQTRQKALIIFRAEKNYLY